MRKFTAIFEQVGEWWIGTVEELPGALAGPNLAFPDRDFEEV